LLSSASEIADDVIPRLRGVIHARALWVAVVAGVVLVVAADGARPRLAAGIYTLGLCALFLGSSLYHRWPGDPRWRPLLRRVDHSTIFVFIAATYTPIALLTLTGTLADVVLVTVWAGAVAGIVGSIVWINAPRAVAALTYIALGWVAVAALPQLVEHAGVVPTALIVLGGVLYSAGAAVYAAKRPDPRPAVFGFHEVFHTFVTAAALLQFVAIAGWVVPL
jgi:hemolysin III